MAEKEAAWQKVNMGFSGFVFTDLGSVLHSTPMASRLKSGKKERPGWRNSDLLFGIHSENPNIHRYTAFPTVDKLFTRHPIWQQAKVESDRRLIFEEHAELKR